MKPVIVGVLLTMVAVAAINIAVDAHAVLVSSVPKDQAVLKTPPKKAILNFNSRIEKKVTQVVLLKDRQKVKLPSEQHFSAGPANQLTIALPSLKPGSYRLEYKVLATDGHLTPGLIRFTISGGNTQ